MGKRIVTDPFRVEFVNWVDSLKEWEWYFTGTFKYECGMEPAKRAFKRFVRYEMNDGVSYLYVCESNRGRGGYHLHALFADCQWMRRKIIWKAWFKRYGRNQILPVDRSRGFGVEFYLSKYLTKELADWDIHIEGDKEWLPFKK